MNCEEIHSYREGVSCQKNQIKSQSIKMCINGIIRREEVTGVSMYKKRRCVQRLASKGGEIYVLYKGVNPYQLWDLTNIFISFVIFQLFIL
jgi:hypothetical protein